MGDRWTSLTSLRLEKTRGTCYSHLALPAVSFHNLRGPLPILYFYLVPIAYYRCYNFAVCLGLGILKAVRPLLRASLSSEAISLEALHEMYVRAMSNVHRN